MGGKNQSGGKINPNSLGKTPSLGLKAAGLPHLEHLLWHGLSPLLGHRDLGVGVEEDLDDLWHGCTGFQHLSRDGGRAQTERQGQRGQHPPAATRVCPTPPRSRLGQPGVGMGQAWGFPGAFWSSGKSFPAEAFFPLDAALAPYLHFWLVPDKAG